MGKEVVAIPIAAYLVDRRRRHKNKVEKLVDPRNLSDDFDETDQVRGRSFAGDVRGDDPLSYESRSTKEKRKRPVIVRFGLRKKALASGAIGLAGLVAGSRISSDSRRERDYPELYPYYR